MHVIANWAREKCPILASFVVCSDENHLDTRQLGTAEGSHLSDTNMQRLNSEIEGGILKVEQIDSTFSQWAS